MPLENHIFTGGMDKDTEDRFLSKDDWREALNIQAGINGDASFGSIEKAIGNIQKIYQTTTKSQCIGHAVDLINKFVYFFICDTGTAASPNPDGTYNQHRIIRYNLTTQAIQPIYKSPLLNFSVDYLITGAEVVNGAFLYWTDDYNEPSKLDIAKALAGDYVAYAVDRSYLDAIPYAPLGVITGNYFAETNGSVLGNNLKNKLYQFKYRYIYTDDTKSSWSPVSKVIAPLNIEKTLDDLTWNNAINLNIPTVGNKFVKRIDLAVRDSNVSNFYKIHSWDKEATDTFTALSYNWYNQDTWEALDSAESNKVFDYVPRKAKSLSLLNNSRVAYGNYLENYNLEEPLIAVATFSVSNLVPAGFTDVLGGVAQTDLMVHFYQSDFFTNDEDNFFQYYELVFDGNVSGYEVYTFSYTYTDGNITITNSVSLSGLIPAVVHALQVHLDSLGIWSVTEDNNSGQTITANYFYTYPFYPNNILIAQSYDCIPDIRQNNYSFWLTNLSITITNGYTGNVIGTPLPSFKKGASHNFGIIYHDKAGRTSCVYTTDELKESLVWFSSGGYGQARARIRISSIAPSWAVKYQIVYGGNNTYLKDVEGRGFIQMKIGSVITSDLGADYKRISLAPIQGFNEKFDNSIVNYTWSRGDRVRPIYDTSGSTYFPYNLDQSYEVIKAETIADIYYIHVLNTSSTHDLDTGDVIEIYSPATPGQNVFYYEFGEIYDIINPGTTTAYHAGNLQNQTASLESIVEVTGGDVYLTNRVMPANETLSSAVTTFVVEESNYSDFQLSNDTNIGRFNIVNDNYAEIRRSASVRYSDVYIPQTSFNGLGTFYDLNFNTYDQSYGSIQKLFYENKKLGIFQELKCGQVLVNESILNDLSGQELVQRSDQVLSDIQYYTGEFGIGKHPESFAVYGFSKYFVDTFRGAVLRLSNDGLTKISDYKMMNYFYNRFQQSFRANVANRIYGVYNERNKEYILGMTAIQRTGDAGNITILPAETLVFNESTNRWTTFMSFKPTWMAPIGLDYCTFNGASFWLHNQVNTAGNNYATFYGTPYDSTLKLIFNQGGSDNKFWKSLKVESNKVWVAPTITNQQGQSSELIDEHFDKIENAYWAPFYKDKNTPVATPLYEGDELRSPELAVTLKNSDIVYVKLFSVGAKCESSELTNK